MGAEEDFADLLDEAMADYDEPDYGAEGGDIIQADQWAWALRAVNRRRQGLTAMYEEREKVLREVYETERGKLDRDYARLEDMLSRWLLAWNAGDEKRKSYTLPCGVKVKSTAGAIEIVPDVSAVATDAEKAEAKEAYDAWCLENGHYKVEVMPTPGDAKAAIIEASTKPTKHNGREIATGGVAMDDGGARVPGVRLQKKPRKVTVTL